MVSVLKALVAPAHVQSIADNVKDQIKAKLPDKDLESFKAVLYSIQITEGIYYIIKVSIGNSEYLHLKVYMPLPMYNSELILTDIVTDRDEQDPFFFV